MVSAELALAVPSVLLVLAICLTALALGVDQVRVVDAARVAARAASRGEDPGVVERLARARAPHGAVVSIDVGADRVEVTVSAPARVRWLPAVPGAHGAAEALWEPGAEP
jgi:hypothetical protein